MPLLRFRNDVIFIAGRSFRIDSTPIGGRSIGHVALPSREAPSAFDDDDGDDDDNDGGADPEGGVTSGLHEGSHKRPREASTHGQPQSLLGGARAGASAGESATQMLEDSKIKAAARAAAKSTLQRVGIGRVSAAGMSRTGRDFSAADMTPHLLTAKDAGYAVAFTATQLPLNRPWDGPRALHGATAYRIGMTGQLRMLWRGVGQTSTVKTLVDAAAAVATASRAINSSAGPQPPVSGVTAVMAALGNEAAFRETPAFPLDHDALRSALRSVGLKPVDIIATGAAPTVDRRADGREKRRRALNKRALVVGGNYAHLSKENQWALQKARLERMQAQETMRAGKATNT